jgi:hypothetical protein
MWRQHHVAVFAVFAAFALLDTDHHAFAIDVPILSEITSSARKPAP